MIQDASIISPPRDIFLIIDIIKDSFSTKLVECEFHAYGNHLLLYGSGFAQKSRSFRRSEL